MKAAKVHSMVVLVLIFLWVLPISFSQESMPSQAPMLPMEAGYVEGEDMPVPSENSAPTIQPGVGTGAQGGGSIVSSENIASAASTRLIGESSQKSIELAKAYVISKLGESYFERYIQFQSGAVYEDCIEQECRIRNEITFSYTLLSRLNSESNQKVLPNLAPDSVWPGVIGVGVTLNEKDQVVRYNGPIRPYSLKVSKEQAIEKAKDFGLKDITATGISTASGSEGYEIVWAVTSKDVVGECIAVGAMEQCVYRGVYVDVDSAEIRGEYRINPWVQQAAKSSDAALDIYLDHKKTADKSQEKPSSNTQEKTQDEQASEKSSDSDDSADEKSVGFFGKVLGWFKGLFS